jgi:tryptophan synthase alpha chain
VQLVTPMTPDQRLAALCQASRGFIYAVTMTGTTGRSAQPDAGIVAYLERVRAAARVPVLAGFGIRDRAHIAALAPLVDGVIVGSALIEAINAGGDPAAFLAGLRGAEWEKPT